MPARETWQGPTGEPQITCISATGQWDYYLFNAFDGDLTRRQGERTGFDARAGSLAGLLQAGPKTGTFAESRESLPRTH